MPEIDSVIKSYRDVDQDDAGEKLLSFGGPGKERAQQRFHWKANRGARICRRNLSPLQRSGRCAFSTTVHRSGRYSTIRRRHDRSPRTNADFRMSTSEIQNGSYVAGRSALLCIRIESACFARRAGQAIRISHDGRPEPPHLTPVLRFAVPWRNRFPLATPVEFR